MSAPSPDPTPFEEDLLRELRIERSAREGARERVASRLGLSALAPQGEQGGPVVEPTGANTALKAAAFAGTRAVGLAGITFVLGAAAGATGHAWLARPEVEIVYLERQAPRAVSARPVAPSEPEPGSPPALSTPPNALGASNRASAASEPRASSEASAPSGASSGAAELGPEITMLDQARKALSEGRHARAFELLGRHARLFPASVLEQEREALTIKALVATGRLTEARARAEKFKSRFPQSMLLFSIEKALAKNP
jgi:hypothetical protein